MSGPLIVWSLIIPGSAGASMVLGAPPLQIDGVFPDLTVHASDVGSRSETRFGALIPWADRLWAIGYVAHISGGGIGLDEIVENIEMRLHPTSVAGTFAVRMVHWETDQAAIGPHVIDAEGNVRTLEDLAGHRLTVTARHLFEPERMAYLLTMECLLFEADLVSFETRPLLIANTCIESGGMLPPSIGRVEV